MNYTELPLVVKEWIAAHPYQTALHVVNGVVMFTPAAAMVPILNTLGFTSLGPAAGSAAASTMSYFGSVPASGVYATVQSAAMGGYGAGIAAGATQAGATVTSMVAWILGRR
ncbi:hypothetical protein K504DRAFT_395321 [Pleomassaria siparia CBS 279.74]|uniref:Uncharacterized protein n=1 Tax=Pleomassaria siparia CBS 279.74 TaxID=1314801 RepID=A0A6G1KPH8_9PLEO|nr:hypothetical protein K504DRAFT_395321 [Pleomassaria siparia CBS 279.74]